MLCREAHAASWLSCGRVRKYFSDSATEIFAAAPVTMTCRSSGSHGKSKETCGFSAIWRALRLSRLVKKTKPRASSPFNKTVRTSGRPSAPTVARLIAFGSMSCARDRVRQPRLELRDRIGAQILPPQTRRGCSPRASRRVSRSGLSSSIGRHGVTTLGL